MENWHSKLPRVFGVYCADDKESFETIISNAIKKITVLVRGGGRKEMLERQQPNSICLGIVLYLNCPR